MWEFIKTTLLYFFFPPVCPICKEITEEYNTVCDKCIEKILSSKEVFRLDYKKEPAKFLEKVFCIMKYREGVREYLLNLKFNNDKSVVPVLKKLLDMAASNKDLKNFLSEIDIATFVPLHEERLKERGYNQCDLIFRDFLISQNLPVQDLLIRSKNTEKLFDLNANERKSMMKDAFSAVENIDVKGKNILIADDIYTTGATTSECAKVLKNLGAKNIYVLAFSSDGE